MARRCRVVQGGVVRLALSDEDFIDVKEDLNAGEYMDLLMALGQRKPFAKILAYLVAWSFIADDEGTPLPYAFDAPEDLKRSTIASLDKATLRELQAALDKHEAGVEADLIAKKKMKAGVPAPSATSISAG